MLLAYNTNGLAHHSPADALALLADIGYQGVGLTLDHGWLNPLTRDFVAELDVMRRLLERLKLRAVVETGARFLLDPRRKHEPTLMSSEGGERRIEYYRRAIDVAQALGSDCVSIWSGILREPISNEAAMNRLVDGLQAVCDYAATRGVAIGFEPEPGMFIDTMDAFARLLDRIDRPELRLTLDIGHLHCQGETPLADQIRRWADRLVNVHLEDMRRGVHEHLMFGDGEIDFPPVMAALAESGYKGLIQVELSRHSHDAPTIAAAAYRFLAPIVKQLDGRVDSRQ